jgi:ABC-type antimicrobial peptide transport system permease subunit
LGAQKGTVARLIVWEAAILAFVGLGLGALGAVGLGRIMQSTLYSVQSFDVSVLVPASALLFTTSLLAAYLPARRAAGIDPMRALRTE